MMDDTYVPVEPGAIRRALVRVLGELPHDEAEAARRALASGALLRVKPAGDHVEVWIGAPDPNDGRESVLLGRVPVEDLTGATSRN